MDARQSAKKLFRRYAGFFNRIPLLNSIRNLGRNNSFVLDKPMIRCRIICRGNNNRVILQRDGGLDRCTFLITGDNNLVVIGNKTSAIRATICIEDSNNIVEIGDDCSLCGEVLLAACEQTEIRIDDGALFSSNIELRTSDSHTIFDENLKRINIAESINIGKRVWIGTDVHINKGVNIGNDCVVGNGSVVTKTFEDNNVIIAGNPAKIIKHKITWDKER